MIKIDKNVPIPSRPSKYSWGEMEINDSILVRGEWSNHDDWMKMDSAKAASRAYGKRHNMKFRTMKVDEGVRIWRVE